MIEFKSDGPFGYKNQEEQVMNRMRIIGIGQAGGNALDQLVLHGAGAHDLLLIDTDQQTIDGSVVPDKILLGKEFTRGLGCGGDTELAHQLSEQEESVLLKAIADYDFLVIVAGLGGGTGGGVAPYLVSLAQKQKIPSVVVTTLPFSFEGQRRTRQARQSLRQLRAHADSVLVFANDRLAAAPAANKNIRQGFHLLNQIMGQSVAALSQILTRRGLIQLSFADIRSLYGRYVGAEVLENCWVGWGEVDCEDGNEGLIDEVLGSPLLAESDVWEKADHALIALTGGKELSLLEVQSLVQGIQAKLPGDLPVAVSAHSDESCDGHMRMTLFLATTAPAPAEADAAATEGGFHLETDDQIKLDLAPREKRSKVKKPVLDDTQPLQPVEAVQEPALDENGEPLGFVSGKYYAKQEELPFEALNRGRFENAIETIYKGENLDIPTFRRRKLSIRV